MKRAIIRSAYDPSIAVHNGTYYLAYECTIENGAQFSVRGTSSCISVYDPRSQIVDLSRTRVVVSGVVKGDLAWAAAIPHLIDHSGRLYLYWSSALRKRDELLNQRVRGAELVPSGAVVGLKGSNGPVPSTTPLATDVWQPQETDVKGGFILDLFGTYQRNKELYVFYASGGRGCTSPSAAVPGCYHLSISRIEHPLQARALNLAKLVNISLPTNPVEYSIPVEDPSGRLYLMGHFIRPVSNGYSELRPMPGRQFWGSYKGNSVYAMAPLFL
jgi:hypothetical protein